MFLRELQGYEEALTRVVPSQWVVHHAHGRVFILQLLPNPLEWLRYRNKRSR
jgi:hypothetical protein